METIASIRRRRLVQGIARSLGISRYTVKKALRSAGEPFVYQRQPRPKLGAYLATLEIWLEAEEKFPARERRTAQRIFEGLRLEGYAGSVDQVRRYIRHFERRHRPTAVSIPQSFAPGEPYQYVSPGAKNHSWMTVDINIDYRVDGGSVWLANAQTNLGIINALDQRAPFVNQFNLDDSGTFGCDAANATVLGREVSLQVVKRSGQRTRSEPYLKGSGAPRTTVADAFHEIFRETGLLLQPGFMHAQVLWATNDLDRRTTARGSTCGAQSDR